MQTAYHSKSCKFRSRGLFWISHDRAARIRIEIPLYFQTAGAGHRQWLTAHRCSADYSASNRFERWRQHTGDEKNRLGPVVPLLNFESYLRQTLEVWESWPDSKQEQQAAITYINLSATGYLDTRLFQAIQVWSFWPETGVRSSTERGRCRAQAVCESHI